MVMLAETDPAVIAFLVALTPLVVVVTTILQSWYQQRVAAAKAVKDKKEADAKAAADKAALEETAAKLATTTKETAREVTDKLETVHKAVNGEGLGGKLDAVIEWQKTHDAQDNQRHDDMLALVLGLKSKVEGIRPPGGGGGGREK